MRRHGGADGKVDRLPALHMKGLIRLRGARALRAGPLARHRRTVDGDENGHRHLLPVTGQAVRAQAHILVGNFHPLGRHPVFLQEVDGIHFHLVGLRIAIERDQKGRLVRVHGYIVRGIIKRVHAAGQGKAGHRRDKGEAFHDVFP